MGDEETKYDAQASTIPGPLEDRRLRDKVRYPGVQERHKGVLVVAEDSVGAL